MRRRKHRKSCRNPKKISVSAYRLEWTGEYDEKKIRKFIESETKGIYAASKKFGTNLTMEESRRGAEKLADIYKHHFRVYKKKD